MLSRHKRQLLPPSMNIALAKLASISRAKACIDLILQPATQCLCSGRESSRSISMRQCARTRRMFLSFLSYFGFLRTCKRQILWKRVKSYSCLLAVCRSRGSSLATTQSKQRPIRQILRTEPFLALQSVCVTLRALMCDLKRVCRLLCA
jgi:hypothetical protein